MLEKMRMLMKESLVAAGLAMILIVSAVEPSFAGGAPAKDCTQRIEGNSSMIFDITFHGGELARVFILGDGHSDLDIYVYDQTGKPVMRNENNVDDAQVFFMPEYTQTYSVIVKNRGNVFNTFRLWTN
jgi:hypothetical protein